MKILEEEGERENRCFLQGEALDLEYLFKSYYKNKIFNCMLKINSGNNKIKMFFLLLKFFTRNNLTRFIFWVKVSRN